MTESRIGRREALQRFVAFGSAALIPAMALACNKNKGLSCDNTSGLSESDIQLRKTLEYADRSADPAKSCDTCQLFKPAGADQCGSCTTVKGPINPKGSCKAFAKKT